MIRSAIALTGILISAQCLSQQVVTVATGEYAPFSSEKLKNLGYVNHVIESAFAKQGIKAQFRFLPWKRAYNEAKDGKYEATSFWYESADRKKDFFYSDMVNHEKTVLFYNKAKPVKDWKTLTDLKAYKFAATSGYTYTKEFWDLAKNKTLLVTTHGKDLNNMKKLVAGRVDIFPAGAVLGMTLLHDNFDPAIANTVTYSGKPLTEAPGYLLFPKSKRGSKALLEKFNAGLKQLKDSGELDALYDDLISGKYKK